eukprot:m.184480 g.184480  ORF g.184480 m.184480 type:complete len:335 (+) comp24699_c0_seq1:149-1153(+)
MAGRGARPRQPLAHCGKGDENPVSVAKVAAKAAKVGGAGKSKYSKREKIGQGTYGVVYKGVSINDKGEESIVALKKIRLDDEGNGIPWAAIREVASLKHLRHPNVVSLLDIVLEESVMWLAFEFLKEDLWSYLKHSAVDGLDAKTATDYLRQLLEAIKFCHHNQVLHRDIKPGNVLLDGRGGVKLADFGMARPVRNGLSAYSPGVVTLWYRPPEVLLDEVMYTTSVDIWSLGCVFIEMLTGQPLFPGDSGIDQLARIFTMLGTPDDDFWPGLSKYRKFRESLVCNPQPFSAIALKLCPKGEALCESMLAVFPDNRISASEALGHPLFNVADADT